MCAIPQDLPLRDDPGRRDVDADLVAQVLRQLAPSMRAGDRCRVAAGLGERGRSSFKPSASPPHGSPRRASVTRVHVRVPFALEHAENDVQPKTRETAGV